MRPKLPTCCGFIALICKPSKKAILRNLPGPTYAVGFVRAYAEYLGLDGAQVADRFKEEGKVKASRTPLVLPSPLPEGRIPSGTILLVAIIVGGGLWRLGLCVLFER